MMGLFPYTPVPAELKDIEFIIDDSSESVG
jgi:hypothetical protein